MIDPVQIEAGVIATANGVWAWCEKANSRGRTVTVKIKWADFQLSNSEPIDGIGDPNKAWAA